METRVLKMSCRLKVFIIVFVLSFIIAPLLAHTQVVIHQFKIYFQFASIDFKSIVLTIAYFIIINAFNVTRFMSEKNSLVIIKNKKNKYEPNSIVGKEVK